MQCGSDQTRGGLGATLDSRPCSTERWLQAEHEPRVRGSDHVFPLGHRAGVTSSPWDRRTRLGVGPLLLKARSYVSPSFTHSFVCSQHVRLEIFLRVRQKSAPGGFCFF